MFLNFLGGVILAFILAYAILGGIGTIVIVGAFEGGQTALWVYFSIFVAYLSGIVVTLGILEAKGKLGASSRQISD